MKNNGVLSFPARIVVELTGKCNLSCHMCPRHHVSIPEGYMKRALWEKIIEEIASHASDSVVMPFWRGETLLHPEFCDFMDFALGHGKPIHMSTNGCNISEAQMRTLQKMEFVTFSIHGKEVLNHARKFASLRNGEFPIIQVSFVDSEETMRSCFAEIISSPNLGGFDSVRVYKEHSQGGIFGSGAPAGTRGFCQKLRDTMVIAVDGSISRCNHQWKTDRRLNAAEMSIQDIWNAPEMCVCRDNYPDEACAKCEQWSGHTQGERWQLINGEICHTTF